MFNESKLIEFYSALVEQEEQANDIKKDIQEQLKSEASELELSPKTIKAGYALFKKYKDGKNTQVELNDYSMIEGIIMSYFSDNSNQVE